MYLHAFIILFIWGNVSLADPDSKSEQVNNIRLFSCMTIALSSVSFNIIEVIDSLVNTCMAQLTQKCTCTANIFYFRAYMTYICRSQNWT